MSSKRDDRDRDLVAREEAAAAAEAADIGGRTDSQRLPEAERPLAEAGEGVAEGFELAEEQLIQSASHGTKRGHPLGDRFPGEDGRSQGLTIHGEADHEKASEKEDSDE
ncbi:MAG: hypothetical protein EDQ89_06375 [Acidobacteria bacterium]|nr:MAG: hypothetical protein EDQ89_06375 [Acidobacteriota bacterium]GIK78787.1 MAG: hypothetical protein BroJett022_24770 [Actinomycetes bacterium]